MTRFDELQQARAMLIRLLNDGKPLPPPVQGVVDDLNSNEVSRMLVTCSLEIILHVIALTAEFDPAKARSIWMGLSSDAVRRLEDLCQRTTKPLSATKPPSSASPGKPTTSPRADGFPQGKSGRIAGGHFRGYLVRGGSVLYRRIFEWAD
jgi:hypothetical protein